MVLGKFVSNESFFFPLAEYYRPVLYNTVATSYFWSFLIKEHLKRSYPDLRYAVKCIKDYISKTQHNKKNVK